MERGRILVVDDERLFRESYAEALSARGHAVRAAASAADALRALAEGPCDLVLADVVMPGRGGLDLVREALARWPELEAVAVTADGQLATAVRAMQAGCSDFLVKPLTGEALSQAAGRALARGRLRREHGRLLGENADLVRSQALFGEGLALLAVLDEEKLHEAALDALRRAADAQGAALWAAGEGRALALRAWRGLVDHEALPPRLDPAEALALAPAAGEVLRVPLVADGEVAGLVQLERPAGGRFGPEERGAAAGLARFAAVALANARRFGAVERASLRDRETGAYHLGYFADYAGKEFYKARRYGRSFSMAVVAADGLEALRRRAGGEAVRGAARALVAAVGRAVRDADVLARVSDGEYFALLPETDRLGALAFARRAAEEIRGEAAVRALEGAGPVHLALGTATFPQDGEDFDGLLRACRARQEEARGSLVRRLGLDRRPHGFWELVDALLGEAPLPEGGATVRLPGDPELLAAVQREVAREIGRDPRARAVAYVAQPGGAEAPVARALPPLAGASRAGDAGARVLVLGPRRGGEREAHPLVTPVRVEGDPRLAGHGFLLLLGDRTAYGLLQSPAGRLVHTSDAPLVDLLVARLQAAYQLQPV